MDFEYPHTRWNLKSLTHCALFLSRLASLCVSLPSCNSLALLPSLLATSGLFLLTLIFLFNLSNSLFLLNLNPQRLWVFLVGFIWLFFLVGLFGFHLICLWVLFDLFVHLVSWHFQWFVLGLSLFSRQKAHFSPYIFRLFLF